ncbi:MAG: hypothetical protein ABSG63_00185 [Spirochaetia bacterium]|jgi:hypothetical protein
MKQKAHRTTTAAASHTNVTATLIFYAAVAAVVVAAVFMVIGVLTPARSGPFAKPADIVPYPYTNVAAFVPVDYIWLYPGILLAPVFILLMACIKKNDSEQRKLFGRISLSFATMYAALIVADYFIQLAVIQPSLRSGETSGLSLFTQYNPHGLFIALEAIGYLLMSTSLLFASFQFSGTALQRAVKWIFISDFCLAVVAFILLCLVNFDIIAFEVTALSINWLALISGGILIGILARRGWTGA